MDYDEYQRGYDEACKAIECKLPGYQDYSQGDTDWDKGWNARIEQEQKQNEE